MGLSVITILMAVLQSEITLTTTILNSKHSFRCQWFDIATPNSLSLIARYTKRKLHRSGTGSQARSSESGEVN